MSSPFLPTLLTQLLPAVPLYIIYLVGIILALTRWHRHPTPSLLAVIAFGLFLFLSLAWHVTVYWIMELSGPSAIDRGMMFSALAWLRTIVSVVAWGLLLAALFGWRQMPIRDPRPEIRHDLETITGGPGEREGPPDTAFREGGIR